MTHLHRAQLKLTQSVGGVWRGHEPNAMSVVGDRPFSAFNEGAWTDDTGTGGINGELTIVTDATAPQSPSNVGRCRFPTNYTSGGSGPCSGDIDISPTKRTVYSCYYAKYSSNWVGHDSGVNKQFYMYDSGNNPWFYFTASGGYSNPLVPTIAFQSIVSDGDFDLGPNLVSGATIPRGSWFLLEVLAVGNTASTADGTIDVWLDGVHITSTAGLPGGDLQYSAGACLWNRHHWTSIWGGVGGPNVPAEQNLYYDQMYVSAK